MATFHLADILTNDGMVLVQGDITPVKVSIKDTFVVWRPGLRVLLSDLGQGGNQYAAIRNVYSGAIPFPPTVEGSGPRSARYQSAAELVRAGASFSAAWAKTLRYDLSYYDPVISGITGTAYATLVSRPTDFRELLPRKAHFDLPEAIGGRQATYVNEVVGGDYETRTIVTAKAEGDRIGDPKQFTYARFPNRSYFSGNPREGIWQDDLARDFGLTGMLPPTASVSFTLIAILIGASVNTPLGAIPNAPVNLSPEAVFRQTPERENVDTAADLATIERNFGQTSPFFAYAPPPDIGRVVYVGATEGDVVVSSDITTPYEDVTNVLKDAI